MRKKKIISGILVALCGALALVYALLFTVFAKYKDKQGDKELRNLVKNAK